MTVAELSVIGTPALLVPLPGAPRDHQRKNALTLVRAGAALLVDDHLAIADELGPIIESLFDDQGRLDAMSAAALGLGHRGAAAAIAELIDAVAADGRARMRFRRPKGRETAGAASRSDAT
jgi:UDP-N-acetylglucosamine--N-acetylmuramyl-(pentapeptide) pyrophosphoryl-undecaprenol N-acetylglucosamine transferase